ncbi:hypothetical protein AB4K20DRAFT_1973115 [Rhizopus microsporus]
MIRIGRRLFHCMSMPITRDIILIVNVSELLFCNQILNLRDHSEDDLLHDVWRFIYRNFTNNHIQTKLDEKTRNESRSLVVIDKAPRKSMGSKGGILFKFQDQELASSEVGKNTVLPIDDRYLNGGLMKLPKTLRDMLSVFVRTNPSRISQFVSVGFLVMELNLELLVADVPDRQTKIPCSLASIVVDFIPLLEVTWKGRELMKQTAEALNSRKRKAVQLTESTDECTLLPYSFVCN